MIISWICSKYNYAQYLKYLWSKYIYVSFLYNSNWLIFTSVYFNNILGIVTNHFFIIMTSVMRKNIMSTNLNYLYIKNYVHPQIYMIPQSFMIVKSVLSAFLKFLHGRT